MNAGDIVRCVDNSELEEVITKGHDYMIESVGIYDFSLSP